jgi:hypothetical protein
MLKMEIIVGLLIITKILSSINYNNKFITFLDSTDSNENENRFHNRNLLYYIRFCEAFKDYFGDNNDCITQIFIDKVIYYDYENLYYYSGHKLTEIGDEVSCLNSNSTYILALLTYEINDTSVKLEDKMSKFTSKEKSNLGVCVWSDCNDYLKNVLIDNGNAQFKQNLKKLYNIKDIKAIINYKQLNKEKNILSIGIKICCAIFIIYIIAYIVLKIIMLIISHQKKSAEKEAYELKMEKRKKVDYLKVEEADIIKEEENEDDINEEEDEEKKKKKNN